MARARTGMRIFLGIAIALVSAGPATARAVPAAIYTDPAPDAAHPARMVVLHVPSGGVAINGVAYLAQGAGLHPTLVLCHGLPGNEKNLDLAQAIRRAGWNVVTFNYRGSWGSPGRYRFAHNLDDADAVLAYLRDPATVKALGVDTGHIVLAGHSMGGWVTALVAGHDKALAGAIMISAGNLGKIGKTMPRAAQISLWTDNGLEALAGTSGAIMADENIANAAAFDFVAAASQLTATPLLALTSDDGLAPHTDELVKAIRAANGTKVTALHVATDHSWSDSRIRLESEIIDWLAALK